MRAKGKGSNSTRTNSTCVQHLAPHLPLYILNHKNKKTDIYKNPILPQSAHQELRHLEGHSGPELYLYYLYHHSLIRTPRDYFRQHPRGWRRHRRGCQGCPLLLSEFPARTSWLRLLLLLTSRNAHNLPDYSLLTLNWAVLYSIFWTKNPLETSFSPPIPSLDIVPWCIPRDAVCACKVSRQRCQLIMWPLLLLLFLLPLHQLLLVQPIRYLLLLAVVLALLLVTDLVLALRITDQDSAQLSCLAMMKRPVQTPHQKMIRSTNTSFKSPLQS